MTITILTPDLSGNCVGRALVLAELFGAVGEVKVVGHQYGEEVWRPMSSSRLNCGRLTGRTWAGLAKAFPRNRAHIDSEVVVVSKRLASSWIYAHAISRSGRRLVLDFDDDERGLHHSLPLMVRTLGPIKNILRPNSYLWSVLADRATWPKAPILVASSGLQRRYGGELLYHLRSTEMLTGGVITEALRRDLKRLSGVQSLVFVGTPRRHKGLDVLAKAVRHVRDKYTVVLGVFGCDEVEGVSAQLRTYLPDEAFVCHGQIPLNCVAEVLGAATAVVIPQQRGRGAQQQTPAKLFDAMCLGRPLITTDVGDIAKIVSDSAIVVREPSDVTETANAIELLLGSAERRKNLSLAIRQRFDRFYATDKVRGRILSSVLGT